RERLRLQLTLVEDDPDQVRVAASYRTQERRLGPFGPCLDQGLDDRGMAARDGPVQRGKFVERVPDVDVGLVLQEELDDFEVALVSRKGKGGGAIGVLGVDRGTPGQEGLDRLRITLVGGGEQFLAQVGRTDRQGERDDQKQCRGGSSQHEGTPYSGPCETVIRGRLY